jgi:3-hydroxyacyl-[acyl-carrier-protein] dehydratase
MRFTQLDRIIELTEGESLKAIKCLSLSEEYLHDHFPRFPVMPGVLMLEALFQASMWLVRHTEDFQHSMVVLRETRNIKFGDFVEPGNQLQVQTNLKKLEGREAVLQVKALIGDQAAVSGRLLLERYNLVDRKLAPIDIDNFVRHKFRKQFNLLCGPRFESTGELDVPSRLAEITAV